MSSRLSSLFNTLMKKYLLIFFFVLIIPIILIFNLVIGYTNHVLEEDVTRSNSLSADDLMRRINTEINSVVLQLQLIGDQSNKDEVNEAEMFSRSQQAISKSLSIHSIYMINENQEMVFEAPFSSTLKDKYYDYPYFEQVRWNHNYAVSDLIKNYTGVNVVTVAIPVYLEAEFKGVLIAELSQDYLSQVLSSISVSKNGFSFIVDRNGKVVASTDQSEIGADYSKDPMGEQIAIESFGTNSNVYQDKESIIAFRTMQDGWGVTLGVPKDIALKPLSNLSITLTLGFGVILLLTLILVAFGIKKLLFPVIRLTNLAQNFDQEDHINRYKKIDNKHTDELITLWNTMIEMSQSNFLKKKEIEENEHYLRNLIEGIPFAIMTINNDGLVTHYNEKFEQLSGLNSSNVYHQKLENLSDNLQPLVSIIKRTISMDESYEENETYIIDHQGNKRMLRVTTAQFTNKNDITIGGIAVIQDITKIKLFEEHVKQREKLASIGQVTTGVAHEIKNPLAILSGASELLLDELKKVESNEEIDELVDDINEVVGRMNDIINNFLSFAKMEHTDMKPVSLDEITSEVLNLLRLKLKESKIIVHTDFEKTGMYIEGNYTKLMQVCLNLFLNSMEAMNNGGTLRICIKNVIHNGSPHVSLLIRDSGQGMKHEELKWLFNPFYTTKNNGSGLGLTIARDIVQEHQGEINVESDINEGTTIICLFPIR